MGCERTNGIGAFRLHQVGSFCDGAGGVDHVVEQYDVLAAHVAYYIHDLGGICLLAALVHDGEGHVQLLSKGAGAGHAADVGRDDHEVLIAAAELLEIVVAEDGRAEEVVHGDVEEALYLGGVEVHGEDAVRAGLGYEVGDQLCGDGVAALGLAVLPRVAEVRDDGGYAARAGAAHGVYHDEQLHEAVVYGLAGGLDYKGVRAAHGLPELERDLPVREGGDFAVAELLAQPVAYRLGERKVGVAREYLYLFAV